jgi:protein involved in polysaccharide export with SLBB domain
MKAFRPAPRMLATAFLGLSAGSAAWADPPPPSPTRLEVPAGSEVKITIEIVNKPDASPAAAPAQPAPAEIDPVPESTLPADAIEKIKPLPLLPIPDDPPPHDGAFLDLPYVVEPPDLLTIEVLEALPGRPISGERLVRADGTICLGFYGDVYVRGLTISQVKEKIVLHLRKHLIDEVIGIVAMNGEGKWQEVAPKDSDRVFVDVTAYNSKNYFIQGDVAAPGKLPHTGKETVLDALNYAGGFIPSADPNNIKLVRPARGGKPARVYKVDYDAILERGEKEKNYQLFPDDRIIVGRKTH